MKQFYVTWTIKRKAQIIKGRDMFSALENAGIKDGLEKFIESCQPLKEPRVHVKRGRIKVTC